MAGNIRMLSGNNTNSRHSTGSTATSTTSTGTGITGSTGSGIKKPRRLWTLHDRSAVSVNLLKANLAQDGCEEAQLNVAKKLLNDTSDDSATVLNENARLAIYWLIKSSEQGNEEATELLKTCLESGKGINCQNVIDVQMCIETPRNDKLTVKAARLLYEKLNNGEDFITTTQLEARLIQVKESRTVSFTPPPSTTETAGSTSHGTPTTSNTNTPKPPVNQLEEDFDETNNLLLQPHAFESLDKKEKLKNIKELLDTKLSKPRPSIAGNESPCKQYHSRTKRHGIKLTEEDMTKNASIYNLGEVPPIFLRHHNLTFSGHFHHWNFKSYATISFFQFVILILMWTNATMTFHSILSVGAAMLGIWSSYNLFGWYWNERRFSDWTTLYQNVLREENWSETLPITRFYQNYRKPYLLSGLLSALMFMLCNVTAQDRISPYPWLQFAIGSLTILVLLLALLVFDFKKTPSLEFLGILAILIFPRIAKLVSIPSTTFLDEYLEYVQNTAWDFIADYFPEVGTTLENQLEYFSIENVLRLLKVFLLSKLVLNAIGRTKLNHGKTLSEVLLVLWIYQFVQWSQFLTIGSNILFVGCCYILLGTTLLILASLSNVNIWKFFTGVCVCLVISLTLLISWSMVFPQNSTGELKLGFKVPLLQHLESSNQEKATPLSWKEYDMNCHQSAWKVQNLGYTQLSCPLKYKDRKIQWSGIVAIVHVLNHDRSDSNSKNMVFEVLVTMEDEDGTEATPGSWKNFIPFHIGQDPENFHSTISLQIPVTTTEDFQLKLIQQLLSLHSGDEIIFVGKLSGSLGGVVPEITDVEKFWCVHCKSADYGEILLSDPSQSEAAATAFAHVKDGYNYLERILVNSSQLVWNYTQNLANQIQEQINLTETVSAIADE